ncbi:hypothetical protein [Pedobacter insulae]|uniref:Uncharacterized protein n=1 Tax=Pedobacter insulae TaxID=414048 RepID=A0A1I2WZY3_9SPHI|nr:hypothetical protein [Pedobacter insulae]SFH06006.1 hypothetical protein SAMN04489864_104362 [Pedobacter insulae]
MIVKTNYRLPVVALFIMFIFSYKIYAQNNKQHAFTAIKTLLLKNFPHDIKFVHHENSEKIAVVDNLYYKFHYPEIKIKEDTLIVSYITEKKEWGEKVPAFEKLVWKTALNRLDEFYGFEFTFGNSDRFKPHLFYWNIVNEKAKLMRYTISADQFYKGTSFTNLELASITERAVWFPSKIKSSRKLQSLFKKNIRKYSK